MFPALCAFIITVIAVMGLNKNGKVIISEGLSIVFYFVILINIKLSILIEDLYDKE